MGRAAPGLAVVATQKPQSDVVPTALRDLPQIRVDFATSNGAMRDTILGAGMSQEAPCDRIPQATKGVGYILPETSRTPARFRAYWVADVRMDRACRPSNDRCQERFSVTAFGVLAPRS